MVPAICRSVAADRDAAHQCCLNVQMAITSDINKSSIKGYLAIACIPWYWALDDCGGCLQSASAGNRTSILLIDIASTAGNRHSMKARSMYNLNSGQSHPFVEAVPDSLPSCVHEQQTTHKGTGQQQVKVSIISCHTPQQDRKTPGHACNVYKVIELLECPFHSSLCQLWYS